MGRRKKEPKSAHREKIASAASALFMEKGIAATSMDDIAKAAGYSKATLYVYFENKEEIVSILVLDSMKKLYGYIASALAHKESMVLVKTTLTLKTTITCLKKKKLI